MNTSVLFGNISTSYLMIFQSFLSSKEFDTNFNVSDQFQITRTEFKNFNPLDWSLATERNESNQGFEIFLLLLDKNT